MTTIASYVPTGSLAPVFSHLVQEAGVFSGVEMYPEAAGIEENLGDFYDEHGASMLAGEAFQSQGEHLNTALLPSLQAFRRAITAFENAGRRDALTEAKRAYAKAVLLSNPSHNLVVSAATAFIDVGDLLQAATLFRSVDKHGEGLELLKRAGNNKTKSLEAVTNAAIARFRIAKNLTGEEAKQAGIKTIKAIDKAVKWLFAEEKNDEAVQWLFLKGMVLEGVGEYLQAAEAFSSSYDESAEPYTLYRQGLALKNAGRSDKETIGAIMGAIEGFMRSGEEYLPLLGEAHYRYGEVLLFGAKEFAKAIEAFEQSSVIFGRVAGNFGKKKLAGLRRSAREWQKEAKDIKRQTEQALDTPFRDPVVRPSKGMGQDDDPPKRRSRAPGYSMID